MMSEYTHHQAINLIAENEFGDTPGLILRMNKGICNAVYSASVCGRDLVFRLNAEPRYMLGSHDHIPLFRSKGIHVPEIVAEDLTRSKLPLAYQVQTQIPGNDIGDVIAKLNDDELHGIAAEVASVFKRLSAVPNNGKFGVMWGDDRDLVDSWSAEVGRVTNVVLDWGRKTGVLDENIENTLMWINSEFKGYFDRVRPLTYFGDISSNNVMIFEGRFAGLVDLDSLAQGDPLEAVGRIKASWYGTPYGKVYSESVMDSLGLTASQRQIVAMYALLDRAFRTLENGVKFNQSTERTVDREREAADKKAVAGLLAELKSSLQPAAIQTAENVTATEAVSVQPARITEPAPRSMPAEAVSTFTELPAETRVNDLHAEAVSVPSQQKIMLEANGLSKTYTSDGIDFDALKNVDLRIHKGDCVAIVGKSGSGKSTLMHLLACLDAPTDGRVFVDGDETSAMSESEKNLLRNEKFGFVFQQFFLNGRDTVFENVVLPMRIRGASDFAMITDADEALASVGLSDKTEKRAKDLSGGEKQRVCIARAIVGKPQVIFADEPTGNLDSNTGAAVENMLFDLNREKGITLVIVTHDPDLADRCGRIVEMKDGRIVAERTGEASR